MRVLALLFVLAFTGCESLPPALQPGPGPVDAIIGEAVVAARAPFSEQQAALARAQQALGSGAAADRLRLATLLATLPLPLRDDSRALELLESIADAGAPGIGRFAALLASQVMERQRVSREFERLRTEVERLAKERALSDRERDKREEALKQQLEALRAIERGILEREEKMRRKK